MLVVIAFSCRTPGESGGLRELSEHESAVHSSTSGAVVLAPLAAHGLIDEFMFAVYPVIAARRQRLIDGIRDQIYLELVE